MSRYTASSHATYNVGYHIIFCTKYRYRLLRYGAERTQKTLIAEAAINLGIIIKAMETMPEHVHLFVTAPPSLPVQRIVKSLKDYSSYYLRKYPSLWTRSYFVETIRHISEKTVTHYIEHQKPNALSSPG